MFESKAARINALSVFGGELHAAGESMGFAGVDHAVRREVNGAWEQVGGYFNAAVLALSEHNGRLVAGGAFTAPGGTTDPTLLHVAQWDGAAWSTLGNGLNAPVRALLPMDGALYAGGDLFMNIAITFGLARLTGTASSWEELLPDHGSYMVPGLGPVYIGSLARKGDHLLVGGSFVVAEMVGVYGTNVAAWRGGPDQLELLAGYMDGAVNALHADASSLTIGGAFATGLPHIARADLTTGMPTVPITVELALFPNPVTDLVTVTVPEGSEVDLAWRVVDASGRAAQVTAEQQGRSLLINTSSLSPGNYFLRVTTMDGEMVGRFTVGGR